MSRAVNVVMTPVGGICNLKCSYCYLQLKEKFTSGKMNIEIIGKLVEKLNQLNKINKVTFTWHGGEPMLFTPKQCELAFRVIEKKSVIDYKHVIQTNGTLISEEYIELFKRYKVSVGVSLDGPNFEANSSRFSKEEQFNLVVKNIKKLLLNKIRTTIFITLTRDNIVYLDDMFLFIRKVHPTSFYLNPVQKDGSDFSAEEWCKVIEKMNQFSYDSKIPNGLTPYIEEGVKGRIPKHCLLCGVCNQFILVNVSGEVFATCSYPEPETFLDHLDEPNIKQKIADYLSKVPSISKDSIYAKLGEDRRYVYFQGAGCKQNKCQENNAVYVDGVVKYIQRMEVK
ncbi:MAG: radical SAM protein [Lactobacillales bacterium]|jgi:uncharacterized protein|nr:radical SAM protein [Lactobacillales bacterium]